MHYDEVEQLLQMIDYDMQVRESHLNISPLNPKLLERNLFVRGKFERKEMLWLQPTQVQERDITFA